MNIRRLIFAILLILSSIVDTVAEPAAVPTDQAKVPFSSWSYERDPKSTDIGKASFQINWADKKKPPEFVRAGDLIPGTKFKIVKFEYKTAWDPKTQVQTDRSELTLLNIETEGTIVLSLR